MQYFEIERGTKLTYLVLIQPVVSMYLFWMINAYNIIFLQ